jgi:hypothetical protein
MPDRNQQPQAPSPDRDRDTARMDDPAPVVNDPGGAHAKGYSADPAPEPVVPDNDPLPLAPGPDESPAIRQPEREGKVPPTGRDEPGEYTANKRLTGAER